MWNVLYVTCRFQQIVALLCHGVKSTWQRLHAVLSAHVPTDLSSCHCSCHLLTQCFNGSATTSTALPKRCFQISGDQLHILAHGTHTIFSLVYFMVLVFRKEFMDFCDLGTVGFLPTCLQMLLQCLQLRHWQCIHCNADIVSVIAKGLKAVVVGGIERSSITGRSALVTLGLDNMLGHPPGERPRTLRRNFKVNDNSVSPQFSKRSR